MLPGTFLSALGHLDHGKLAINDKARLPFADTQIGGKRGVGRDPCRSAASGPETRDVWSSDGWRVGGSVVTSGVGLYPTRPRDPVVPGGGVLARFVPIIIGTGF
jgi:hypothetical protein